MRSGLWYSFGLVTAAGLTVLWKSPLTSRFLLYLFSRGDNR